MHRWSDIDTIDQHSYLAMPRILVHFATKRFSLCGYSHAITLPSNGFFYHPGSLAVALV